MKKILLCALAALALFLPGGCGFIKNTTAELPVTVTDYRYLGTVITISIYESVPGELTDKVMERIGDIHNRMSANIPNNELDRLNKAAGRSSVPLSADTLELLALSEEIARRSEGCFDVTIGPLVKLWNIGGDSPRIPAQEEIDEILALVDYAALNIDERNGTAGLDSSRMAADLGGIAKGYACDEAVRILRENGVSHALLDLGGNVYAHGAKPDGSSWRVGIRNPVIGEEGHVGVVEVADKAVVTSGSYERYFEEDGVLYHHIFDPRTGYSAESGLLSMTIVGESSAIADALSTACFVLGSEKAMALVESFSGVECVLITANREILVSPGLRESFTISGGGFTLAGEY